ncbi:uncharacterized protein T551_00765 [Pneumocystis jirovecii RU7]|uniref:Cytochrome b mRNA-processing protein 4 n=1 Tax=Pneumocystis jirovecii (strain RU7) TaxID=1408657 RepID=A0A0W4ZUR4_PNEJ7|nr:uncharacterized protein T551_00765 [Pneumocystis jirovecii RU7]KTW32083.1 hypothetical protein T551_00765 [Pneumocystis jirovecii RU7]
MTFKSWIKGSVWGSAIVATGYGLMIYTTPNEQELYHSLSPTLKSMYDKNLKEKYTEEITEHIKTARILKD